MGDRKQSDSQRDGGGRRAGERRKAREVTAPRKGGRQDCDRMRETGAAWSAQDSLKQTVCKLETGKHSPVWNNGGWRRLPLSTRFPEPGHPVPSVLGCLLPPMGGPGPLLGLAGPPADPWPSVDITWSLGGGRPTHLLSCLSYSPGRRDLGPGVLQAPPGQTCSVPLPMSPRGFPSPASTLLQCRSPNPHLPPEPHPSPPPRPELSHVCSPPYPHP